MCTVLSGLKLHCVCVVIELKESVRGGGGGEKSESHTQYFVHNIV